MNLMKLSLIAVSTMAFGSEVVLGEPIAKKGTTPYVTHFIFRPLMSIDIPGLGTATNLEAVGTTQNMKGEKMLDKMSAHCAALSVASGDKKYIDGACVLADSDGDKIFSTFDTRDTDKSQPQMSCGCPYRKPKQLTDARESVDSPIDERSLQIDLVRSDRAVPAAGRVGSRK